jgi:hypothetical protein
MQSREPFAQKRHCLPNSTLQLLPTMLHCCLYFFRFLGEAAAFLPFTGALKRPPLKRTAWQRSELHASPPLG